MDRDTEGRILSSAPLVAYGDESESRSVVTYAFVVIPAENIRYGEGLLRHVKEKRKVDPTARLHCRELFHARSRKRTRFAHLSDQDINELYYNISMNLFDTGQAKCFVGVVSKESAPTELPQAGPLHRTPLMAKTFSIFALQAASIGLQANLRPGNIKYLVDSDRTKIPWVSGRRQVNQLAKVFSLEHARQIHPELCGSNKPELLEVADFAAYASAHALDATHPRRQDFQILFTSLHASKVDFNFRLENYAAQASTMKKPEIPGRRV